MNYGWILIIIAAIMWGIDGILLTPRYFFLGLYNVPFIVFVSHLFPLTILSIFNFIKSKNVVKIDKKDYIYFILITLFGGTIGTLAIVKALQLSNFSNLSLVNLLQKSQPIFSILLAYILLKERPKKNFYIVAFISIISIYFLIFGLQKPNLLSENNLKAAFYSLLAALSFGSSTVFGRKISMKYDNISITFYRFLLTTVIVSSILIFNMQTSIIAVKTYLASTNMILLSIVIAFNSLISIVIYYKGMTTTKATYATICELFYPITAVILDAIVFHNYLSTIQLVSAIILVISILYINLSKK